MKKNVKLSARIFCFMMILNLSVYAQAPLQWSSLHQRPGGTSTPVPPVNPSEINMDVKHLSSGNAIAVGRAYPVTHPTHACDLSIRKYRSSDGVIIASYFSDFYAGGYPDEAVKVVVAEPYIYVLANSTWVGTPYDKDIIILKLDTALNFVWSTYFNNGTENDIAVDMGIDASGNIYILGNTNRAGSGNDIVLLKYDQNGANLFTKYFTSTGNYNDKAAAMAVEPVGICNITGYYGSATFGNRMIALKLWGNGVQLWLKYHDVASTIIGNDQGVDITYDPVTSDVYVTGFGPNASSTWKWAIVKFDGVTGNKIWMKAEAGGGKSIRFVNGQLYTAGEAATAVSGVTSQNVKLLKLDKNTGNILFTKIYNYANTSWGASIETVNAMAVSPLGNVYITGTITLQGPVYVEAYHMVLGYSSSGTLLWSQILSAMSTSGIQEYAGKTVSFSSAHNSLYVGGYIMTTMSLNSYASLMKFGPVSLTNPNKQLREEEEMQISISVFPNPATDFITIKSEEQFEATVELYDITGKLIIKELFNDTDYKLNVSQMPRGTYILRFITVKSVQSKQIVLN